MGATPYLDDFIEMAKPTVVGLGDWNRMVEFFHSESDRGAAILAGSFAEHALGTFLNHRVGNKKLAEKLFGPVGPLSSFSQRIAVAFAFKQITQIQYNDLEAIRQARNYFAHHPFEASFSSKEVQDLISKTAAYKDKSAMQHHKTERDKHRIAYLLTCGMLCARLLDTIDKENNTSSF